MATLFSDTIATSETRKFGGNSGISEKIAIRFVPDADWNITSLDVQPEVDTGTPTGDVVIRIMGETSSLPNEANVLGSATIPKASVGGVETVSISASVTNGTAYWISYSVSSGLDDSNCYRTLGGAQAGGGATTASYSGGAWASQASERYYRVITGDVVGGGKSLTLLGVGS